MLVPLGLLSVGAVFAGIAFHHPFIEAEEGLHFWGTSIAFDTHLMHEIHNVPLWVKLLPAIVMITGFLIALRAYIIDRTAPGRFTDQWGVLYRFLYNKWFFDELYNVVFIRPSMALGRFFWKRGDEKTINRFGPDGAATLARGGNALTARLQSGYLYTYALVMLLGLAGALTWVMAR